MKKMLWLMLFLSLLCAFLLSACDVEREEPENDDTNQSTSDEQNNGNEDDSSQDDVVCQHAFGDWTVEKQATCKESGVLTRICSKCSEREETTIAKTNDHTVVINAAVDATCDKTGLTEGKYCSLCEKVLMEQIEIPLKPHTYDDKYDETCNNCDYVRDAECAHLETEVLLGKSETCTSAGLTEGSKCKKCGEVLVVQEVISELGHIYTSVVTAPTCTEQGYTTYTCICTDTYVDDYVDASGHSFGDWTTVKDATTTEEGLQERTCKCGEKETQTLPKIEPQGSAGLEYTLNNDGLSYSVSKVGFCTDSHIVIPATYENKCVTSIGEMAFQNCNLVEQITIPDSVTSIGPFAFENCSSLSTVNFGKNILKIVEMAFSGCTSLKTIDIPESVILIDATTFEGCTSLESITIPNSVETIYGSSAVFSGCTSLNNISVSKDNKNYSSFDGVLYNKDGTELIKYPASKEDESFAFPYTVTSICGSAFKECRFLKNVIFPNGIEKIGSYAFYYCISLESIDLPDTLKSIGNEAFESCLSLKSIIIPDQVTTISSGAFASCISLKMASIGKNVKTIGGGAFGHCTSLTDIIIPNSVIEIGYGSFSYCTSLTTIIIPDSVVSLYTRAFEGSTNLTIYCEVTERPSEWLGKWNYCASHINGTDYCTVIWGYVQS